jgi:hypothetical protein
MSQLIVITFPQRGTAAQAAERLKSANKAHAINIDDMAVIEKDADGKVHSQHGVDTTTAGASGVSPGLLRHGLPGRGLVIGPPQAAIGRSLHHTGQEAVQTSPRPGPIPPRSSCSAPAHQPLGRSARAVQGGSTRRRSTPEAEARIQAALDRRGVAAGVPYP